MTWLRKHIPDFLIAAGFFILPLLLFANVTLGGKTMIPADNLYQWQPWAEEAAVFDAEVPHNALLSDMVLENIVWKRFIRQSLENGELPLWNSHIFAGTPFLATGQHSAYYPFSILFLILPILKAYGWFTVLQLWLAGIFAFYFGRVLKMQRASAALTGLIFQGCGFILVSAAVFPMILAAAVWLPLLLAAIEKVIRNSTRIEGAGKTLPWAVLGMVALGFQVLAGHIEITYYSLLVMGLYAAWRLVVYYTELEVWDGRFVKLFKPAGWLLILVIVGLMLGAVQFIPFVEVGQANFREGSATLAEVRDWAFPMRRVLTLAVPDFFGNPADHSYVDAFSGQTVPFTTNVYGETNPHGAYTSNWGIKNYVEGGIYLGILPLILSLLGIYAAWKLQKERRIYTGFFTVLSLFSLSFIFGTPLYAILYYGLPGINQLHSPFRWVFPLSLCVAVLAGFGADYLALRRLDMGDWRSKRGDRSRIISTIQTVFTLNRAAPNIITALAGLAFWSGLLLLVGLFLSRIFYSSLEPFIERLFMGLAQAPDAFPNTAAFYSYEFRQFFMLGLMLVGAGAVLRVSRCPIYLFGRPIYEWMAVVAIGLDLLVAGYGFNAAADPALLEYQPPLMEWLDQQPGLWRLTTFTPHGDKPLNANTPWLYDYQDIRGYDSVILKQYTDYMAVIEPQNELQFNRVQPIVNWESLNSPLLDLLGVKYIISSEDIDLPKLQEVWQEGGLRVYENLAVVPRAYTISRDHTLITDDALNKMRQIDPRQYVIEERPDGRISSEPAPGTLTTAEITAYSNIEVKVQATVEEDSWLVLNDTYFTGWDAFVRPLNIPNAEETKIPITRVNGNFRGVRLEPGSWEVRFRYSPLSFKIGGLTSFMGGIIILFSLAVWAWRQFYNPEGELTNTRSIAKNSLAPMALNLFNRAIDFGFAAFYLRLLGPEEAGKYATAIIIAGWFEIISNFGLNTLIIREVSKDRSSAAHYLLNTTILRLGTGFVGGLPVFIYVLGVSLGGNALGPDTTAAIIMIMAGMVFSGMGQGLAGLYYAYETAEFPATITTVTTIMKVGFGVIVLLAGFGFVGLAAVSIIVNIITLLILAFSAFRHFALREGKWKVDFGLQRQMIGQSYPLMLNHFFAVIFFQIDIPLLRQYNGEEVVGWYNSAYKWVNAFNVIPSFFTFALFPVISRQVESLIADARRTFRMSLKIMLLVSLPLAAVTTVAAPLLIGVLGGEEFLPHGAVALQLVIWSIPIGWMNSVTNYVLIALGVEKRLTSAFIIGVAFNIIANLILLPRFSYIGASVTTILSEVILLVLFARYLRPKMPGVRWLKLLQRPLAVTAIMLVAMVIGSQFHIVAGLAAGIIAYPVGLLALRVFGEEEKQILSSLLPERVMARIDPFL